MKVKVVPYTFVRRGVPVRENTYAEPSACEVGWPAIFLAAFISAAFPLCTHLLLGEQSVLPPGAYLLLGELWASIQSGHRVGLKA